MDIADRASLRRWCRDKAHAAALEMSVLDIATRDPAEFDADAYPDTLDVAGHRLPISYAFEPGSERDGITLRVPEPLVGLLRDEALSWLVPGWVPPKALALLRGLPKELRRALVPLPDTVQALLPALQRQRGDKTLIAALGDLLAERFGLDARAALEAVVLPAELQLRMEVVDPDGRVVAASREVAALQRRFARGASRRAAPASGWSRANVTRWEWPTLPDSVRVEQYGTTLALYPALLDRDGQVDLELIAPGPAAPARHRLGVRRLLLKQLPQQTDLIRRRVLEDRELVLSYHGVGSGAELVDDVTSAAADDAFDLDSPIRSAAEFDARLERGRAAVVPAAEQLMELARKVLTEHRVLKRRLEEADARLPTAALDDLAEQIDALVHPRFLSATPQRWRGHVPRYLKAAALRLDKLRLHPPKDAEHQAVVRSAAQRLDDWRQRQPSDWPWPAAVTDYRWLLEELRVSLFAQGLGTSRPVSAKRLEEAWRRKLGSEPIS